jgi:hypothetical protein
MVTEKEKNHNIFECKQCNTITDSKKDLSKHFLTAKHQKNVLGDTGDTLIPILQCEKCNRIYKSRNGLWKHSKTCNLYINKHTIDKDSNSVNTIIHDNEDFKKLILEVIKSNTELQKQNHELQKQVLEVCKNGNTVNSYNNSHNKTFNLNFFLNEQCKDAMNISEFVKTFDLQLADLESVGELGYVEGITKIMIDKLNSMDIYKRPIHCSDAKREIMYVKDEDKWEKEGRNNPKLRKAIKTVSFQNMKLANLWSNTYPESKNNESHLNDTYMKLIRQSTGGSGDIGISEDKIIRRIAKEVIIGKM